MLGRNISGKSFLADRWINERRRGAGEHGETKSAEGAALLVLVRLRRVAVALVRSGFHFHLRAAARFLDLRDDRLPRNDRERDRAGKKQAEQKAQSPSHHRLVYHLLAVWINLQLGVALEPALVWGRAN
jgi:hypothetical protein